MPVKKNVSLFFVLILFCVPFFFLNIQDTFSFGDDWSQYAKEGLNLATGKPYYVSNYIFNPLNIFYAPPQYPPGYPMLLAPVIYFFGLAVKPILYLNAIFLSALLFSSYYYFRKRSNQVTAVCLSLILTYTPFIIDIKKHALSDLPCTLFVTIYFALRSSKTLSLKRLLLLCIVGVFCVLIRTQAIFLILSEIIVLAYEVIKNWRQEKKFPGRKMFRYPSFFLVVGMLLLFLLVNNVLFPGPKSTLVFYKGMYSSDNIWTLIGNNANYLVQLFTEALWHKTHDPFFQLPVTIITMSAVCFGLLGFVTALKKGLQTDVAFFILMCGLILITQVYQGPRYILPILPVFLLFAKDGMSLILPKVFNIAPKKLAIICTVIFIALGYDGYEKAAHSEHEWAIESKDSAAFSYIRSHIKDNEIILFAKPRLLALYTDKKSMNIGAPASMERNRQFLDSMHVTHLLLRPGLSEPIFYDYLRQPGIYSDSVKINDLYTLYRLR